MIYCVSVEKSFGFILFHFESPQLRQLSKAWHPVHLELARFTRLPELQFRIS